LSFPPVYERLSCGFPETGITDSRIGEEAWNNKDINNPVDIMIQDTYGYSASYDVMSEPEPITMILLGFALTGFAMIRGKFKN
jgi:hypothetical protein